MPAPDDLGLLLDAAEAAGRLAMARFGRPSETWEKPDGAGPVSAVDLEIDRMLREELTAARPDYGWLSEETEDGPARLAAERCFVVDPIDGTRAFLKGESSFAVSLAVVAHGRPFAAVVRLPKLERTYAAAAGAGATRDGAPIRPTARAELQGASVLAPAVSLAPDRWPGGAPPVERHFRPSLAYRLCLTAEGRFDAMLTLRDTWEWDVAAGTLIAAEAGAAVTDRTGAAPAFNKPVPKLPGLLAAGPALHASLLDRLVDH